MQWKRIDLVASVGAGNKRVVANVGSVVRLTAQLPGDRSTLPARPIRQERRTARPRSATLSQALRNQKPS
jgi:hypothetical protein